MVQFLAAHELKRQSWRFHKQHNAWFQRFTEPTITSDEYEQARAELLQCVCVCVSFLRLLSESRSLRTAHPTGVVHLLRLEHRARQLSGERHVPAAGPMRSLPMDAFSRELSRPLSFIRSRHCLPIFFPLQQTGWCYRRKENFTFRYNALEDELRVIPQQQLQQ